MAVLDLVRPPVTGKIDGATKGRLERGRNRLSELSCYRNEALEFWRGNQYWYVDQKGVLQIQPSGAAGVRNGSKLPHKVRQPHNLILDVVAQEVSAATSRVPSYEVDPATTDPDDLQAAKIAERVALYGYDKWNVRDATVKAVTYAVVADEAFAWPYWDSTIGPYINGTNVGVGDVCVEIFGGNQVFWEPGQRFEKSAWHAVDVAMTVQEVENLDGFNDAFKGKLKPDADALLKANRGQDRPTTEMVLVTYYLERPSPQYPKGRWKTYANDLEITPQKFYPGDGSDPCLHKLSYIIDPDSDRDMGLVRHLIPAQRTYNDCQNKLTEFKNLAMMPQWIVSDPALMKRQKRTDEPGAIFFIPNPDQNWKQVEPPQVPRELFEMADRAQQEIARLAAQNDIPSQVEAGRAIQALIERDQNRRQAFIANLAEWHSKVMRACLALVQEYYSEPRTLQVKGEFGPDPIETFKGANLRSQIDVRVYPASIEPRLKADVERRVMTFAQLGWITPEVAMSAINSGTAENLVEDYEKDVSFANRIIRQLKAGSGTLLGGAMRKQWDPMAGPIDPVSGAPRGAMTEVPKWMPRPFHNIRILKSVFESFMKSEAYDNLEEPMQEATDQIYDALLQLEAQKAAQEQAAAAAQAEGYGQMNAAKPQVKPNPSMPGEPGQAPDGQSPLPGGLSP